MFDIFKTKLTVDQAADALYNLMGKDDPGKWLSQLSDVPKLDLVRAGDELLFLDVFAIYCSLKFTRYPGWSEKRFLVFASFLGHFLTWLANFWQNKNVGTMEDAQRVLDARFTSYGANMEATQEDPAETLRSIGATYAAYAFADDESRHIPDETVVRVAGEAFNHRIQSLDTFFATNKLK